MKVRIVEIDSLLNKLMIEVKLFKYGKGSKVWNLFASKSLKGFVKTRWRSVENMLSSYFDAKDVYAKALETLIENSKNAKLIIKCKNAVSFNTTMKFN
jgi:hypothetical protein